jgi:hypothetical protein
VDSGLLSPELEQVIAAARRLPECDGAAKLHALVARVCEVTQAGGSIDDAAETLAAAARAALDEDPWVRFEAAARALCARSTPQLPA